ncbi:unnamed protein product [Rotaria sordida]|uniref:Uncharacterized protein n=2 Tax=Rotaria sordida TaxID=392033 RepID=A0A815KE67_9BILA|nr:unnamed protein product [Rotaria sordida]CAF3705753.1 unnamed protein product [Rotaria sordida]
MSASPNGSDPCTYKKVQDDSNTNSNYNNQLNTNVLLSNDAHRTNTDTLNTNIQQINSSSSTTNESQSINRSSNNHSKTS